MKDDVKGYLDLDDFEEVSGVVLVNFFVEIVFGECLFL